MNIRDRSALLNHIVERDDMGDCTEAYADGVVCCIKCTRAFGVHERKVCSEEFCPMHGEP